MSNARALVLTGYGLNCDYETAHAFKLAGADPVRVHINSLIAGQESLSDYQIMAFVGGFSFGDDHGAGVVQAVKMKTRLGDELLRFIDRGGLVIGICNGFQVLVNLGLLPGFDNDYTARLTALTVNDAGNFRDDWVTVKVNPKSPCVFLKGFDLLDMPIRHGEGKFFAEDAVIDRLKAANQVALTYVLPDGAPAKGQFPANPNGSVADIAGICDPTGRVFGLMPHPEAFIHPVNHPQWTHTREARKREAPLTAPEPAWRILKNAVVAAQQSL